MMLNSLERIDGSTTTNPDPLPNVELQTQTAKIEQTFGLSVVAEVLGS
jgi:hypothetical protein